jgi:hypothetical protein
MKKINQNILMGLIFMWASFANGSQFSICFENDVFVETDRHYTHGTKFLNIYDSAPDWADKIWEDGDNTLAVGIAQYMYTPDNIEISELQEDDRPYGAWMYLEGLLINQNDRYLDLIGINIGIIGEDACGEEVQSTVHDIIGSQNPNGWEHQIGTEIGVNLIYQKKTRFRYKEIFDIIPQGGACLGNIFTYANAGCMMRLGYNIPDNFGILKMEPSTRVKHFGIYLFGGCEGRYVAHNIFLDGNTFKDSHNVDRKDFVGDLNVGVGINFNKFEIIYSNTYRGKEFKGQDRSNGFGTVVLSWKY